MQVKRILSALLLVLMAWFQVGLPVLASTGVAGRVQVTDNTEAVYRASTPVFTTAASATDIFNFKGSSTKTVYIRKIVWKQANLTAGSTTHTVYLLKRSTANSGGTSSAITAVPLDSSFPSATASGVYYTANPTVGTSLGALAHAYRFYGAYPDVEIEAVLTDATKGGSPIVLRGTSESVSVNYNGVTDGIGTSAVVDIEWSEK